MIQSGISLAGSYDPGLVILSFIIAIVTSYTALDLAGRVTAACGQPRLWWLLGGAFAMGTGIWSMHFIGMLAFSLPIPVYYDVPTVVASHLAAMFASIIALHVVSRQAMNTRSWIVGGLCMGSGIGLMHYTGMFAMRLQAIMQHDPGVVALSVVLAVSIALVALRLAFRLREETTKSWVWQRLGGAVLMGAAILVLHYTAMAGASFTTTDAMVGDLGFSVDLFTLGPTAVSLGTFMVLGLTLLTSLVDRRMTAQAVVVEQLRSQIELMLKAGLGIYGIDHNGLITFVNPSAAKMLGYTGDELIGIPIHVTIHHSRPDGSFYPLEECPIHAACKDGTRHPVDEEVLWRKDGTCFPVEYTSTPIWEGKTRVGAIVTFQDITLRKQAKMALLKSEENFRLFADLLPVGAFELDAEGRCVYKNRTWDLFFNLTHDDTFGFSTSECPKEHWVEWFHPDDRPQLLEDWVQGTASFREIDREVRLDSQDSSERWVQLLLWPMVNDQGIRNIGALIDITQRKEIEGELRLHQEHLHDLVDQRTRDLSVAKEDAEQANRTKSEFLANMWHELRTPMHGILSFSSLGLEKVHTATPEKLGTYFELIQESGQRLMELINSLLDLSTLESDGLSLSFQQQYLRALVETSVQQSEDVLKEKSLKIYVEGPEEPIALSCDGERITQVMKNILSNAMKYSPAETSITIQWFPQPIQDDRGQADSEMCPGVCITIRDEGVGIPQDELESVFDKFVQSSRTKTGAGGIGLGLAICQKIVTAHGGRVWADNHPDGGTIIYLVLPLEGSKHTQQGEEVLHGQLEHTNLGG